METQQNKNDKAHSRAQEHSTEKGIYSSGPGLRWAPYRVVRTFGGLTRLDRQEEAEGLEWALGATGRGKGSVGWRSRELYLVWKKPEYVFHTEREPGRRQEFKVRETGRSMT